MSHDMQSQFEHKVIIFNFHHNSMKIDQNQLKYKKNYNFCYSGTATNRT